MELQTLVKEYNLLREEAEEKFVQLDAIEPSMIFVEEYWITSDHTLGNRRAYFENYTQEEEYAYMLAANRAAQNQNGEKPFCIYLNGKETKVDGKLLKYLKTAEDDSTEKKK